MRSLLASSVLGLLVLTLAACSPRDEESGLFDEARFRADIERLASDEFEGREPGTVGEERTVAFLQAAFADAGLQPGNGDSYFQEVPLVAITPDPSASFSVQGYEEDFRPVYGTDFVTWTRRVVESSAIESSDVVFVGYGIVAPEYGWDDYAGLDARGKTVVMLVNDPGFATQDSTLFTGNAMTYYGRWTYKFEEAARQGAAGALLVHRTAPASYPWAVVQGSWMGAQYSLVAEDGNLSSCAVEGWVTEATARSLFQLAGQDFDQLDAAAAERGFRPVDMGIKVDATLSNAIERTVSRNVVGLLPGSERPDEVIVYMGHWDHLGRDTSLEGDQIFNGAVDNATGTAALLELARAFAAQDPAPARSVLFLAVTAEEQGLLGSAYYAAHPLFPPEKTVAAINIDALFPLGKMNDVTMVGVGHSELDAYAMAAAAAQGRSVSPDARPERGSFYRSDHFSFAKIGVPALYLGTGVDHVEHGEDWAKEQMERFNAEHYHKVSDEYNAAWDVSGMLQDMELLYQIGLQLAGESTFPAWRPTSEFAGKR